ncbi:hypothetical protein [Rhodopila sp.]|uniref:hypothetical protein n=1 Tax=Rhodopila sp. TaxID=2480087 RepID=UPI002CA79245|nr:hypothetical protein [Rhodopila sp.]HVZ07751.1 hypothetical protein [Rhodopila sp.]
MEAQGYQWRNAAHGERRSRVTVANKDDTNWFYFGRNGGLVIKRRVDLYQGDRLIRFSVRKRRGEPISDVRLSLLRMVRTR